MADLYPEADVGEMISEGFVESYEAEANITKGYPVYLTADMKVSPSPGGDDAIGIALKTVTAGKQVPVCRRGIVKVQYYPNKINKTCSLTREMHIAEG